MKTDKVAIHIFLYDPFAIIYQVLTEGQALCQELFAKCYGIVPRAHCVRQALSRPNTLNRMGLSEKGGGTAASLVWASAAGKYPVGGVPRKWGGKSSQAGFRVASRAQRARKGRKGQMTRKVASGKVGCN